MGLSEVLAELYRDKASVERVAVEAGIDVSRVSFAGKSADSWHLLLTEAEHQNRLSYLVGIALREYPQHPPLLSALLPTTLSKPDGRMNPNIVVTPPSINDSEAAVIARLATQLEYLTVEVKRVSDGLNAVRNLNVEKIERGLDDVSFMRGRVTVLTYAVAIVTGMTMVLSVAFLLHL